MFILGQAAVIARHFAKPGRWISQNSIDLTLLIAIMGQLTIEL
jgi:hypothetical protein